MLIATTLVVAVRTARWAAKDPGVGLADVDADLDREVDFAVRVADRALHALLSADDVKVTGNRMSVTVHSLGSVDAPAAKVVLRDRAGKVVATAEAAPLKAPLDLVPRTEDVSLSIPAGAEWKGGSVSIEMSGNLPEITQLNNRVQF
jgi:hypothetical protein